MRQSIGLFAVVTMTILSTGSALRNISIAMPGGRPTQPYSNLCVGMKLDLDEAHYIVRWSANLSSSRPDTVHTVLFGCSELGFVQPDNERVIWDCGHVRESDYPTAPACKSGATILFGERNNGQQTTFPRGVGIKIGSGTGINYLVLRIHYAKYEMFAQPKPGDTSGLTVGVVRASSGKVTKRAGLIAMGPGGSLPPLSMETLDVACKINEDIKIYPFYFRTHSHKFGRATYGWKIDHETRDWSLIGSTVQGDASMFYRTSDTSLVKGDFLAARCVMNNTSPQTVFIGSTVKDEMCNFFLYYYVDGDTILDMDYCWTPGPPKYRWELDKSLPSVPDHFKFTSLNYEKLH